MINVGFGLFDQLELPEGKDYRTLLKEKLEVVRIADRLGCFDTFFSTERHFTRLSVNLSQSVLLAALSQITSRMRLGALVYVLPLRNPLVLAEEISMLDHITDGRLEVGFGSGISELEMKFFGLEPESARAMSREAFELLIQYFRSDSPTFSFEGSFYRYSEVPRIVRPVQTPHPPVWVPSRNKETMKWLGKEALNTAWMFDSYGTIKSAFDNYWKSFTSNERKPKVGIVRHLLVAKTDEEALKLIRPALVNYGRDERYLFNASKKKYASERKGYEPFDLFRFEDPDSLIKQEIAIAGSPRTVASKIKKAISLTGANYFIPYMDFGDTPHERVVESIELFEKEVFPEFN
ncbi:MAG: LLM class flavin-dependent oxidoreductase [Nitrososphaerota archaeon]|jgi:alkanesulfonate monooxygenase SsuD/methylene tetrahydromethanopterin reductase-like flavin-dependent oxidoreductase (luciferase family)|nr:LLM class flavin-dependent oxidoreductase [Nitrososphaerota archaeon]